MCKNRIAVFASGSGTNFQSIVRMGQLENCAFEVVLLVCDKPNATVIERAKRLNIPTFIFDPKQYKDKQTFEQEIKNQLEKKQVELIVLAGYMRLIGKTLLSAYEKKIVNIHPSLLPAFPGKDAIGQALDKNVQITGVTIHFVDEGMDTGPIIAQEPIRIEQQDTKEEVARKIHEIEHQLYPKIINDLCLGRLGRGGGIYVH